MKKLLVLFGMAELSCILAFFFTLNFFHEIVGLSKRLDIAFAISSSITCLLSLGLMYLHLYKRIKVGYSAAVIMQTFFFFRAALGWGFLWTAFLIPDVLFNLISNYIPFEQSLPASLSVGFVLLFGIVFTPFLLGYCLIFEKDHARLLKIKGDKK